MAQTSKDAYELGVEGNSSAQTILIQTSAPEYSSISKTELAQDLYGLGKDEVPNKEYRLALNNKLRSRISKIKNKKVKDKLERNIPFTFEEAIKYALPHGVTMDEYRTYLSNNPKNYPQGAQDQDIFRFLEPKFYPRLKVDYKNTLT